MNDASLAGIRLAPGAPLLWCLCKAGLAPGDVVVVECAGQQQVGLVVVAPHQLLDAPPLEPGGRVARLASVAEREAWERERVRPTAGAALAREIRERWPASP